MHYGVIKTCDIANGEGVRVTLFVSGCTLHCPGCFQPETWNFEYGEPFDDAAKELIFEELSHTYVAGLSVLGGEPFEPANQPEILELFREVHERFPKKTIWVYTGYCLDVDIQPKDGRAHCDATDETLSYIDVLVDGPFMEAEHDITLAFRGSANQRVLDMPATLKAGEPVLYKLAKRGM